MDSESSIFCMIPTSSLGDKCPSNSGMRIGNSSKDVARDTELLLILLVIGRDEAVTSVMDLSKNEADQMLSNSVEMVHIEDDSS